MESKGNMRKQEKIVYLDCDGVLNRAQTGDMRYFTPECFSAFRRIIAETGAKVVLSTSWREFTDWRTMLRDFLGAIGIEVIGSTPTLVPASSADDADESTWASECADQRAEEIRAYAYEHGISENPYVVLDDWDLRDAFPGHCVCTCAPGRIGLDETWADEAIKILNGEAK